MVYDLDPAVDVGVLDNGKMVVRSPSGDFVIVDPYGLIGASIELLRDGRPIDGAFSDVDPKLRDDAIGRVLRLLLERRIVREIGDDRNSSAAQPVDPLMEWLAHISGDHVNAAQSCAVVGAGVLYREFTALLTKLEIGYVDGLAHLDDGHAVSSIIACADAADHRLFREVNKLAIERSIPFLPVSIDRHVCAVGPMIVPRATACYECYFHRLNANRQLESHPRTAAEVASASLIAANTAASFAIATLVRFLAGAAFDLHLATVVRHSVMDGRTGHTVALKLPRCPICGPASLVQPLQPIRTVPEPAFEVA